MLHSVLIYTESVIFLTEYSDGKEHKKNITKSFEGAILLCALYCRPTT